MIGYGSFDFFEKYDLYLETKDEVLFAGTYIHDDNFVVVNVEKNDELILTLNDETYLFSFNGEVYENDSLGMSISIKNNQLFLYKDGEEVGYYSKLKK